MPRLAEHDEQFYADSYAMLLEPAKPDLKIEIVLGEDAGFFADIGRGE